MFDTDGPVAREIAALWWFLLVAGTAVFVAFAVALFVVIRRGRRRAGAPEPGPPALRRFVIGGGAVMPAVVLTVVLGVTIAAMRASPADRTVPALRVVAVGHQWWYEFRYPDHGVVTANELHLPAGRPIELELRSADVIHSFWVPGLAGKLDMLPDRANVLVLQADELGEHRSQCAEFCGLQHARMRLLTIVESAEEFDAWVAANRSPAADPAVGLVGRGRAVFAGAGCGACHTVAGTEFSGVTGPDLTHLSQRRTIGAGTLARDTANLRAWIEDPGAFKFGVKMPAADLSDGDMEALLAYLGARR